MAMNYGGEGGDGLERGTSADAAELQQGTPEPSIVDQIRAAWREEQGHADRRLQSFSDRTISTLDRLNQRLDALETKFGRTDDIAALVEDLHEATIDADTRKQKQLERQIAKLEQAPQPKPQPQQGRDAEPVDYSARFAAEIAPDLVDFANLRGLSDEMAKPDWEQRLAALGAPQSIDYSPQGIRDYKDGMKRAINALAQQVAAARRGRTVVPAVQTAGAGSKTWDQAQKIKSLSEMSDDDYERFISQKR